ncbi:hypothetical protein C1645_875497 [Glomus cerebriforme]|uniref:Uncharacterized protein n=1 Tax=Glomus cerebriforme TaxID=658196 RepID=A0A397T8G0_9GLOM|nr:hypothetical protein C1645_875497 [Glomus cerebriforme]
MTHPNNQFSADSGNNQPSSISTPYNPQDNVVLPVSSHDRLESSTSSTAPNNAYYVQSHNLVPNFQLQQKVNNTHIQTSSSNIQIQTVHPIAFFFRPPNDYYHYYVKCKEITNDTIAYLLNRSLKENNIQSNEIEFIFYYQQQINNKLYQVSYEIVSPLLVNNCLSKNFLGVELQQNMEQEFLELTDNQKEYVETQLKKYLSQYVLGN